jgi:peptidoglycan/xylan/chitin deacetylase (PgdA/CDA1 family)
MDNVQPPINISKNLNDKFYKNLSLVLGLAIVVLLGIFFQGLNSGWLKIEQKQTTTTTKAENLAVNSTVLTTDLKQSIIEKYKDQIPTQWGENLPGVKTKVKADKPVLALTFDATGIEAGRGYDEELINYLIENQIPATLFLSGLWIDKNPEITEQLAKNPLFEIANLGTNHLPCSVNGKSVYGILGTKNIEEVIEEIENNALKIANYTGQKPKFYRAGTAYSDEICIKIAHDLGYEMVGFNVLGDAGATYSKDKVKQALLTAPAGSIVIFHMNIPESETFEGIKEAIPALKEKGIEFVKLSDYPLE